MNSRVARFVAVLALALLAYYSWRPDSHPVRERPSGVEPPQPVLPRFGEEAPAPDLPLADSAAIGGEPLLPSGEERPNPILSGVALPPTYEVDLETGRVGGADPAASDLWWEAKTETERCLCPSFQSKAQIARIPSGNFHSLEADQLAGLDYSAEGIEDTDSSPGVQPGLMLAVRTTEGNLAKVMVYAVAPDRRLTLEWHVFKDGPGR